MLMITHDCWPFIRVIVQTFISLTTVWPEGVCQQIYQVNITIQCLVPSTLGVGMQYAATTRCHTWKRRDCYHTPDTRQNNYLVCTNTDKEIHQAYTTHINYDSLYSTLLTHNRACKLFSSLGKTPPPNKLTRGEHQRHDESVETEHLGKDENEDHAHEQTWLLGCSSHTRITNNPNSEPGSQSTEPYRQSSTELSERPTWRKIIKI